ncbi:MAG: helix-turn-helix domain-containing protein [Opitutaceae bacterium]
MWREFVELAEKREMAFNELCARFGVSRKTGYKWLNRFRERGVSGLQEQSRRPKSSPRRTPEEIARQVLTLRREHPDWSAQRIATELKARGVSHLPAPSTIDLILRRHREAAIVQTAILGAGADALRFEPNFRWVLRQGEPIKLDDGRMVMPVLLLDETTNFVLGATLGPAAGKADWLLQFVEALLRRHGMPWRFAVQDGAAGGRGMHPHSELTVWLMRHGVAVDFVPAEGATESEARRNLSARLAALPSYQRAPLEERKLPADMLAPFYRQTNLSEAQAAGLLAQWREQHNFGGRHEAMQKRSPISVYRPSIRPLPDSLPEVIYAVDAAVRLVSEKGILTYQRRLIHIGRAFAGLEIEIKPTTEAEHFVAVFAGQVLGVFDLAVAEMDETTSLPLSRI